MSIISRNALFKRSHLALERSNWSQVAAKGDWFQNGKRIRTYYVLDERGDVLAHYWDLVILARDLKVLGAGESVEGHDMPPTEAGRPTENVDPAGRDDAEVAAMVAATLGKVSVQEAQASMEAVHQADPATNKGPAWVSWPKKTKAPYTW